MAQPPLIMRHVIAALVTNEPGVLAQVAGMFAARGFNIDSLVVSQGRSRCFSRMTIGITGSSNGLEQIVKQVYKLIDVIECNEHASENAVVKEMLLIKFLTNSENRTEALQIIEHFDGKGEDITPTSMVALITGSPTKLDAAINMLSNFEIIETVRTGKVVIARGSSAT